MRGATLVYSLEGVPLSTRAWRRWRKHGFRPYLIEVWDNTDEPDEGSGLKVGRYRVKFVPWQTFRHRFVRCAECGRRMNRASRHSYMGTDKVWHDECMSLGRMRANEKVVLEALDRLLRAWSVDDAEALRSLVVNPFEARDQFLLWHGTWARVEWYRNQPNEKRWRAPNQRADFWRQEQR